MNAPVEQVDRNLVKLILGETTHTIVGYKIDRGLAFTAEVEAAARHRLAERERLAAWVETQRNHVPATGEEFAAAIRSPAHVG